MLSVYVGCWSPKQLMAEMGHPERRQRMARGSDPEKHNIAKHQQHVFPILVYFSRESGKTLLLHDLSC